MSQRRNEVEIDHTGVRVTLHFESIADAMEALPGFEELIQQEFDDYLEAVDYADDCLDTAQDAYLSANGR